MYIFLIFIIIICISCYITTKNFDWLIPIFYLLFMLIICLTFLCNVYFGMIFIIFIFVLYLGI